MGSEGGVIYLPSAQSTLGQGVVNGSEMLAAAIMKAFGPKPTEAAGPGPVASPGTPPGGVPTKAVVVPDVLTRATPPAVPPPTDQTLTDEQLAALQAQLGQRPPQ